jgi:radical SAM protein with 4Fe4S-binding SPASM domain
MTNEDIKKVIDQISEAKSLGVGFNGGEPTLRKDIYEIISYAKTRNLIPLIATNAISIDENNAYRLKQAGLLYAQVSLDGTKETHEKLRGKKGCYDEAINGIKNLVNQGVYVSVALLANKKNYDEIDHVLKIAKKYGASKFEIIDYQTIGKANEQMDLNPKERDKLAENLCMLWKDVIKNKERISLLYKNPAFVRSMKKIFSKVETAPLFGAAYPKEAKNLFKYSDRFKNGIFSVQDPFSPIATCCEAGLFGLFIDVDGSITPCPYMPLKIGNIKDDNVHDIWKNSEVLNQLRDKNNLHEPCFSCDNKIICGGCRARAFNITGDYLSADPLCSNVTRTKYF